MTRIEGEDQGFGEDASAPRSRRARHVVRRVVPSDVGTLVEVLARAFDDDPVPQWLFRGDRRRRRGLRAFFAIQLRHTYLERGEVYTTEDLAGAALWSPPGRARPGWRDLVRLVPVMPYLTGLGRDAPEAARLLSAVDAARPRDPHWYLATLGTDPDRQRTGVGSALLGSVLHEVDAEGLPAYLESSKESNLSFYNQHGFEVTGEIRTPRGGPTLWLMWRQARPPAA
ncbi:MAG TPA: GNAT family N-acetyltransferase [Acidimicrobiales bacterium]|nr:GNAT family N-acetyltransferase [Acidimicrobiales bacterium]HLN43440.1 GNAT family N-acetyltransferase [Acidimicrobiales bacterium]